MSAGFSLPGHEGVVRVPQEGELRRADAGQDLHEVGRVREVAVRLDEDGDAGGLRVGGHLLEALDDALHHLFLGLALGDLVPEHPHVLHAHRLGEVDEPPALVELLLARGRVLLVHPRRRAEVADDDPQRGEVLLRLREARAGELGDLREVHLAGDAAQLDRGVAEAVGGLQDGLPAPGRAAQGRERDRVALRAGRAGGSRARRGRRRAWRGTSGGRWWS